MRRRTILAALAGATTAHPLYAGAVRAVLRRNVAALMAGDPGPLLKMYAADAQMTFPGESTWGRTYRGRDDIEGFLRRFLAAGLRGEVRDIFVAGPPWATRIALQFDDWAHDDAGTKVYENRAVIILHTRWGKVVEELVYEDTQKVAAFDELVLAAA
jgi:uncharacterized protein (TIGR02246 family)